MGDNVVTELNPAASMRTFLTKMFGSQTGYVYSPFTAPKNASEMEQHFFKWPSEAEELIEHVIENRASKEIYISPMLFRKPELSRENLKGTQYVWAEFNGETPGQNLLKKIPTPTFKIRTSTSGHEVWFWDIQFFSGDIPKIENTLKRIAFWLKADLSAWHYESVIRMPSTIHHRTGLSTYVFDMLDTYSPIEAFTELEDPPLYLNDESFESIPDVESVVYKYSWKEEHRIFFIKTNPTIDDETKKRNTLHKALTRLAFICAEMGMDNKEMMAILLNADNRWKLWADRPKAQQKSRIVGLINYVRVRKPVVQKVEIISTKSYGFLEFLQQPFALEWAVENLIQIGGTGVIVGDSGTGKTRFGLHMCLNLALGKPFLIWKPARKLKMLFVSLEMDEPSFQKFSSQQAEAYSIAELEEAQKMFEVWPIGHSNYMDNPKYQPVTLDKVKEVEPDGIIIDSFGAAISGDIKEQTVVRAVFEFLNSQVKPLKKCFILFIHHNVKHGDDDPNSDHMFGSVYVKAEMASIIQLHLIKKDDVKGNILRVRNLKTRMAQGFPDFKIRSNNETLQYEILDQTAAKKKLSELKTTSQKPASSLTSPEDEDDDDLVVFAPKTKGPIDDK